MKLMEADKAVRAALQGALEEVYGEEAYTVEAVRSIAVLAIAVGSALAAGTGMTFISILKVAAKGTKIGVEEATKVLNKSVN